MSDDNTKPRRIGKEIANRLRRFADKLDKPDVTVHFESNVDEVANAVASEIRRESERHHERFRDAVVRLVAQSGVRMTTQKNIP